MAMLQYQAALLGEMLWRGRDQLAQVIQPLLTGHQSRPWLEPHISLRQMCILRRDVGWIGYDQVKCDAL